MRRTILNPRRLRLRFARQLYRAAVVDDRYGSAPWTTSALQARRWALGHSTVAAPWRVWTARVPPAARLAQHDDGTFVVRTDGLEVVEFDTSWLPWVGAADHPQPRA